MPHLDAAADRSRGTDLYSGVEDSPAFADVSVLEFDVLDELTAITAPALAAAAHAA